MLKGGDEEIETTQAEKTKTTSAIQSHEEELPPQSIPPPAIVRPNSALPQKNSGQTTKAFSRMQTKVKIIPENRKGQLNTHYLATLPGILKIAEVILGFVAFILAICADRRSTSSAWTEHITFETTIVVCTLILLYVVFPHLTLIDERTRDGLVVVELLFYGLNTLFFFIGIWLMVHLAASWTAEGRGAAIMSAILCLALCVIYALEAYLKFKAWSNKSALHPQSPQEQHQVPPAPIQHQSIFGKRFEQDGNEERAVV